MIEKIEQPQFPLRTEFGNTLECLTMVLVIIALALSLSFLPELNDINKWKQTHDQYGLEYTYKN